MALIMPEISPQIPSGIGKVSVEVEGILAETDFVVELDLAEGFGVQEPSESRGFAQVGQILREMLPLEVQIEEAIVQPPSINVDLPIEVSAVKGDAPEGTQQLGASEIVVRARILPVDVIDTVAKTIVIAPLETVASSQILQPAAIPGTTENSSTSKTPTEIKLPVDPQVTVRPESQMVEKKLDRKPAAEQTEIFSPRSGSQAPVDIASVKLPESKLLLTAEVSASVDNFGLSISDKLQIPRSLQAAVPTIQTNPNLPQTAEAKIVLQISTAISTTSKDTVEIRLDPPELGRVIISLTQSESGLSATVTSEKAEISDLLRRHAEVLSRELAKSGFGGATLEFSHRDHQQDRPAFEGREARLSSVTPEQTEATSTIEMALRSQSGSLDIRL